MAEENKILIKFLTGNKNNIDAKIADHTIDAGDIILTKDTDEMIFINPDGVKKIIKNRTQADHIVNHEVGSIKVGETLNSELDFDQFLDKLFGGSKDIKIETNNNLFYEKEGVVRSIVLNITTKTSGTIKVYYKKGDANAELIGQSVGSAYTITHNIATMDQTNNTDFYYYATLNDNQISNEIHIRIAPMVFCDCSYYTQDLTTVGWNTLYNYNDSEDLFGELKNEYFIKVQQNFNCARFIISTAIGANTQVKIYSESGDNVTGLFTKTNFSTKGNSYYEFRYDFPISYPNDSGYFIIKINS